MSKDMKMIYRLLGLFAVLVVVVALLPSLRQMYAPVFPEGFQDLTCSPNKCGEGEFCNNNVCTKRGPTTAGYSGDPEGYFN